MSVVTIGKAGEYLPRLFHYAPILPKIQVLPVESELVG